MIYSPGVIFDKFEQLTKVFLSLDDLKDDGIGDGDNLRRFKQEVSCWNGTEEKTKNCSTVQIIESDHVEYRGILLSPKGVEDGIPKLSDVRRSTVRRIKEELSTYFPHLDDLEAFSVLNPSNFPSGTNLLAMYGVDHIREVAEWLGYFNLAIDPTKLYEDWGTLLRSFYHDPEFERLKKLNARLFW